jgi:Flp pilus assembly pilin Flp
MGKLVRTVIRIAKDDRGLELVEVTVITELLVAAIVTALTLLSGAIASRYGSTTDIIQA